MWLVVVEDADGRWMSEPEIVKTYRDAKDAIGRKADGTVRDFVVIMYEMTPIGSRIGALEE